MFNRTEIKAVGFEQPLLNFKPLREDSQTYYGSLIGAVGGRLLSAEPHIVVIDENGFPTKEKLLVKVIQVQMITAENGFIEFVKINNSVPQETQQETQQKVTPYRDANDPFYDRC